MSINANHYRKIKELDTMAEQNGFAIVSDHRNWNVNLHDQLALVPQGDHLPPYSRDAVIYRGDVHDLISFLYGWEQQRRYLNILGACDNKRIQRKEQDSRNKKLVKIIKETKNDSEVPF